MKRIIIGIVFIAITITSGCASTFSTKSATEKASGYTYIPVDPFAVYTRPGDNCIPEYRKFSDEEYTKLLNSLKFKPLLESFPDNAVRMSIEKFDASGNVTYGPAGLGIKGESYRVTVDYVNCDTTNFPVWIAKWAENSKTKTLEWVNLLSSLEEKYTPGSEEYSVLSIRPYDTDEAKKYVEYNIPVYVGIGLRVTANIDVIGAKANISGLGVIGAEAETNTVKGTLIVQTLGINGKSIAAALPIQSELNRTTAQNAIVAVGAIKALLYDDKTVVSPRVVGIYLPFPGGKPLVNAIISEISKQNVEWRRPCLAN